MKKRNVFKVLIVVVVSVMFALFVPFMALAVGPQITEVAASVLIIQPNDAGILALDQMIGLTSIAILPTDSGKYNLEINTRCPGETPIGLTIYAETEYMTEHRHGIGVNYRHQAR